MGFVYPERESKTLEFKSNLLVNFTGIIKTCVAFANGVGGKIVIGVDDKSREITGVSDKLRDKIYDEFPNSLYDATSPSLLVEIYEKRFNDVGVMIIDVPSSIRKPVFVKSEGNRKGVYLRAGSNTKHANEEYIEELMRENRHVNFDEETVHADMNILSQALLKNRFGKPELRRLLSEKIITRCTTNAEKYYPTISGTLMFCDRPNLYIPESMILCTRFHGTNGRDIIQSEEMQGNIEEQAENSLKLVSSWLMREYKLFGAKMKGKTIVPEIALREAIVNALIHRKYWIPGTVKIALYDDRLEIFNPGNFPGLVDVNHLGDGTTYLRNPNLARLARHAGLVEKLGSGIKEILDSCKKVGIKKPEFIEGADSVKVVFSFLPDTSALSSDEEKLIQLFKMQSEVQSNQVQKFLNVSRNTAARRLNQLIASGKIKRVGKGPSVKYIPTNQNNI